MTPTKSTTKDEETKPEKIATPGGKYFYANGKRKTSVARVRLYKGAGSITINNKTVNNFCNVKTLIGLVKFPLKRMINFMSNKIHIKLLSPLQKIF
jgi:ribosomal protein S9